MIEIAIEGIDGSGKSCLAQKIVDQLEKQNFKTGRIDVPRFQAGAGSYLNQWLFKSGWNLADRSRCAFLIIILGAAAGFYYLLCRRRLANCDYLVTERHPVVNVPVYGQFYAGWLGRILGMLVQRLWPWPDRILFLDIAPHKAYQRLCRRGRPRQRHEALTSLTFLAKHLKHLQLLESTSLRIVKVEELENQSAGSCLKKIKAVFD